jgi:restriction system protein
MNNYYRIMMGAGSKHIQACLTGNFIGIDYEIKQDLTKDLSEDWREFNQKFIPIYLSIRPDKTRVAAGLAMGAVHTVSKGIKEGDLVLSPDGLDHYHVAEVTGPYVYSPEGPLPHRRPVKWLTRLDRSSMSDELQRTTRGSRVVVNLSEHGIEINKLIPGSGFQPPLPPTSEVEDLWDFVMEKHLEDFLVGNWAHTDLGKDYVIYEDAGEKIGQQYQTDTGPIDILAISKDKKTLLVVELKKGRASDVVAGQILRYMGYVREALADSGQKVKGLIIASKEDLKLKRALVIVPEISFMHYTVNFKLFKD